MSHSTDEDATLMEMVAAQRRELTMLLGELEAEAWDRPSLCVGWRVREVVAHMIMPFRYTARRFATEMLKARGNFDRMSNRCARRDATPPRHPSSRSPCSARTSEIPGRRREEDSPLH
jgi:uncharacterized protein (TIGR03083 family)